MRCVGYVMLAAGLLAVAAPARADVTVFLGTTTTPANRAVKGVAIGGGLLAFGWEFEYASTSEDAASGAPALRTGMGNFLLQTPIAIGGFQPYLITGAGLYREELGGITETSVGVSGGGGLKYRLAGPLRVRTDYRVFTLRGDPRFKTVHRVYAGANFSF